MPIAAREIEDARTPRRVTGDFPGLGVKQSGHGRFGIREFADVKVVHVLV